ncbi:MAG: hypothetical protein ABIY70_21220 [Capsulimonas sp.]|uniref:phage distal tail protein n=1 Tax=Capsulimonas sp. TaxID=2494211 RepID=UPI0032669184
MAYLLKYGDYEFPTTMRPASGEAPVDIAEQERPRGDGSITQVGRQKSRSLSVKGEIAGDTPDDLQATYAAMRAACAPGRLVRLYHGRDDQYVMAQAEGWTEDHQDGLLYGTVTSIAITFRAPDPAWCAAASSSPDLDPAGGTISYDGAPCAPTWSITVDTGGAGWIRLANTLTGETATLTGTFADGDVIDIDRAAYTVAINGVADFGLMGGRIPSLAAGDNDIALTTHIVSVSSLTCAYTPRQY